MTTQVLCGYPLWLDGMQWTGLLGRQYDSGTAVIDSGASALALTPAGGVYQALAANLAVTAPVSGLSVNVAPGYCMVPSAAAQAGGYRFGLMSSGSLTVASNSTGSTRQDYVLATVSDVGNSSSLAEIQYVTGTTSPPAVPNHSIILAQVAVSNGASDITSGMITDKRTWVCSPGGILYLPAAASAIAAPASQFFWENDTGRLVRGSGSAGSVKGFSRVPPAAGLAQDDSSLPSLTFTADGQTDYEIYYAREPAAGGLFAGQVRLELFIDAALADSVYIYDSSSQHGRAAVTYYTSSGLGTTPSAGTHTASLALSGFFSGAGGYSLRVSPVVT